LKTQDDILGFVVLLLGVSAFNALVLMQEAGDGFENGIFLFENFKLVVVLCGAYFTLVKN
jgi:hypothetical protein